MRKEGEEAGRAEESAAMALKRQLPSCVRMHTVVGLNWGGGRTAGRRWMYCDTSFLCCSVLIRLKLYSERLQRKGSCNEFLQPRIQNLAFYGCS